MSEAITYGMIENALVQLGFDITVGPDYRLYYHAATDTTIVTPDYPLEQAADEMQLATVRTMVITRAIAQVERLERLLHTPFAVTRSAAFKKTTVRITHAIPAEVKA